MSKKSVLYIVPGEDYEAPKFVGVKRKIKQQCAAFSNLGYEPTLLYFVKKKAVFEDINEKKHYYGVSGLMVMCNYYSHIIKRHFKKGKKFDIIYVRKNIETPLSLYTANILSKFAEHLIYEIPTYPYDDEYKLSLKKSKGISKLVKGVGFTSEKLCRKHLKKHIDYFAVISVLGEYPTVFGAPAIMISNGINVSDYKPRTWIPQARIRLLIVANVQHWHGCDRVITGLSNYYANGGTVDIEFNIVGEGRAIDELRNIVESLDMGTKVLFHGVKSGAELDEIFNDADLGISGLGGYRIGASLMSALKVRDYCSRGLPYVTATNDFVIPDDFTWKLQVTNDDTALDIDSVIEFYGKCVARINNISEMRVFAEKNLSWETQIGKITRMIEK